MNNASTTSDKHKRKKSFADGGRKSTVNLNLNLKNFSDLPRSGSKESMVSSNGPRSKGSKESMVSRQNSKEAGGGSGGGGGLKANERVLLMMTSRDMRDHFVYQELRALRYQVVPHVDRYKASLKDYDAEVKEWRYDRR